MKKLKNILFSILELIYYFLFSLKKWLYQFKIFPRYSYPELSVISVGNLTVGGSGKTPFTLYLAKLFLMKGKKVAVVLRGYKGKKNKFPHFVLKGGKILSTVTDSGDEAFLYGVKLSPFNTAAVIVAANRPQGIELAQKDGYEYVFLDDAHQRWDVLAQKYIVLWDLTYKKKNLRLLPQGRLREPIREGMARADYLFFTRCEQVGKNEYLFWREFFQRYFPRISGKVSFPLEKVIPFSVWKKREKIDGLAKSLSKGKRVNILCAIGNPVAFKTNIEKIGYPVEESFIYSDHYICSEMEIKNILNQSLNPVIITEKDGVKLWNYTFTPEEMAKIWVAVQNVEIEDERGKKLVREDIESFIL